MGLGFGAVLISDSETETAADSTAAALRETCCLMITRARERGLPCRPGTMRQRIPVSTMPPPPSSDTGCMDTTIAPRAEVLRDRYRSRLPERLPELAGPVEGNVDLPLHIVWSGRTSYSLDRPKSRMTLYRTVLAEGLSEDLVALLHHRLLTEQWPCCGA